MRTMIGHWCKFFLSLEGGGGIGKIRIFGLFSGKIRISRGKNCGFREKIVGNLGFWEQKGGKTG